MPPIATRAADALSAISAMAIVAIGVITCTDVAGRYLFSAPLRGAHEVLDMLTCLSIFPALARLSLQRTHISVDLIDGYVTPTFRSRLLKVIDLLCAAALAVVAYRMFVYAGKIHDYGDQTLFLKIPLYPYAYMVSAMSALAALACIVVFFSPSAKPPTDTP